MSGFIFSIPGLAVIASSLSLLYQVISVYQTKSIDGIGAPSFLLLDTIAAILWMVHGRRTNDKATVISTSLTTFMLLSLGTAYYLYKNNSKDMIQEYEDDRFQYGGPMMTRGEDTLSMPGSQHFAGSSDQYRGSPEDNYYEQNDYDGHADSGGGGFDENDFGGLFGGAMVTSGNDM